jgi:hypothetical protein
MLTNLINFDPYLNTVKRNVALIEILQEYVLTQNSEICNQISALIKILTDTKTREEIARSGDTFLWQNILLLLSDLPELNSILNSILVHLFDNYYDVYPVKTSINIILSNQKDMFCFPKLNFLCKNLKYTTIIKVSHDTILLETESIKQKLKIKEHKKFGDIIITGLTTEAMDSLLMSFLPKEELKKICPLTSKLEEKFLSAFKIIKLVDIGLYHDMNNMLSYIFPLAVHSEKTRASFSVTALNGIIFISDGGTLLDFCEAFIHEFYHNELNILLQFRVLFDVEKGNVYYSPWRTDLRPIAGLYHAIYVFVGVAMFYSRISRHIKNQEDVNIQLINILKKLNIAFHQLDDFSLTTLGEELIKKLYVKFASLTKEMGVDIIINVQEENLDNVVGIKKILPNFLSNLNKENCSFLEEVC